jgi:hypothetical protein
LLLLVILEECSTRLRWQGQLLAITQPSVANCLLMLLFTTQRQSCTASTTQTKAAIGRLGV